MKNLEDGVHRMEQELANKTSTINMLMKKMEQKCQEVKTAQQRKSAIAFSNSNGNLLGGGTVIVTCSTKLGQSCQNILEDV